MEDPGWVSEIVSGKHRYKRQPGQGMRWGGRELSLRFIVADVGGADIGSSCCFQRLSLMLLCLSLVSHLGIIYCLSSTCLNFICSSCGGDEQAVLTVWCLCSFLQPVTDK